MAVALAALAGPAATARPAAAAAGSATLAPPTPAVPAAEAPTIDPVLDAVAVDTTPALRRADDRLATAVADQNQAALRWMDAERRRAEVQGRSGTAAARAAAAQQAVVRALEEEAAARTELARRRRIEQRARARLAAEQGVLRDLGASLFASSPDDAYAVLGAMGDVTRFDRRDAMRDRGLRIQSERVDAATTPWAAARAARRHQDRALATATRAREQAATDAAEAADERDRFAELLRVLEGRAAAAAGALADAQRSSRDALVDRRVARLGSQVAGEDLPLVALHAYWLASATAPCTVPWWLLAGVGRVETRHGSAQGSRLSPAGETSVPILGIPLDGRPGTIAVPDSDGGRLDHDATWDRAVGPMQFIPGTWGRWGRDGDGDGTVDPHNIYDAAAAAAAYLCFGRGPLDTDAAQRGALLAYNRSNPYGTQVLAAGHRYRDALDLPDEAPPPATDAAAGSAEGQ